MKMFVLTILEVSRGAGQADHLLDGHPQLELVKRPQQCKHIANGDQTLLHTKVFILTVLEVGGAEGLVRLTIS